MVRSVPATRTEFSSRLGHAVDDGDLRRAAQLHEQRQRRAHGACAVEQHAVPLLHTEVFGRAVALAQGQQQRRVHKVDLVGEAALLLVKRHLLRLADAVLHHGLLVADQPELSHAAVGLGIAVAHVGAEIGVDKPVAHLDVAHLFAHLHHLAGTLVAQHGGVTAKALRRRGQSVDDAEIRAGAEAAGTDAAQAVVGPQLRDGDVIRHLDDVLFSDNDALHQFHDDLLAYGCFPIVH